MYIKVRGVYSTALTALLKDFFDVVDVSEVINDRFDEEFDEKEADAEIVSTNDNLGVGVHGIDVEEILDKIDVDIDCFKWKSSMPRYSVFNAIVKEKRKGGVSMVLDDGKKLGFLPYSNVDQHIEVDDCLRVQVVDPYPIWSDRNSILDSQIKAPGSLVTAISGGKQRYNANREIETEISRLVEMFSIDVPEGWSLRYNGNGSLDEDVSRIQESIKESVSMAEKINNKIISSPDPKDESPLKILSPEETWWVLFGRNSKFTLDSIRKEVKTTLEGHHKIKNYGEKASAAVDFVEDIGPPNYFPASIVFDHFGPSKDDSIYLKHGKPDGSFYSLGKGKIVSTDKENQEVIVKRKIKSSGIYDGLEIKKQKGDIAITKFKEGSWRYPTLYKNSKGEEKGKYINVNTPVEIFSDRIQYIDLHIDVIELGQDIEIIDREELSDSMDKGEITPELGDKAEKIAEEIKESLENNK